MGPVNSPVPPHPVITHQRTTLSSCFPDMPRTEAPLLGQQNTPYHAPYHPIQGAPTARATTRTSLETSTTRSSLLSPSLSCKQKRSQTVIKSSHRLLICSSNLAPQHLPQTKPKAHAVSASVPSAFYDQHPKQELAFLLGSF